MSFPRRAWHPLLFKNVALPAQKINHRPGNGNHALVHIWFVLPSKSLLLFALEPFLDFGLGEMASNSSVQIRQSLQEKTQFTVNSNELGWLVSSIRKHDRQYRQTWDINDLETVICLYRAALEFFRVKSAYAQIRCACQAHHYSRFLKCCH